MKERPILFSGPMVRALLAGTKTQTRRVVKPQPELSDRVGFIYKGMAYGLGGSFDPKGLRNLNCRCPYGQPGDRLWVKETTVNVEAHGFFGPVYLQSEDGAAYLQWGLGPDPVDVEPEDLKLRPSLFMTRKMSRITLEVTGVRVERLQDINESDAREEGIEASFGQWKNYTDPAVVCLKPVASYRTLWESINGPGSWDANPWVWVVEFKRHP